MRCIESSISDLFSSVDFDVACIGDREGETIDDDLFSDVGETTLTWSDSDDDFDLVG